MLSGKLAPHRPTICYQTFTDVSKWGCGCPVWSALTSRGREKGPVPLLPRPTRCLGHGLSLSLSLSLGLGLGLGGLRAPGHVRVARREALLRPPVGDVPPVHVGPLVEVHCLIAELAVVPVAARDQEAEVVARLLRGLDEALPLPAGDGKGLAEGVDDLGVETDALASRLAHELLAEPEVAEHHHGGEEACAPLLLLGRHRRLSLGARLRLGAWLRCRDRLRLRLQHLLQLRGLWLRLGLRLDLRERKRLRLGTVVELLPRVEARHLVLLPGAHLRLRLRLRRRHRPPRHGEAGRRGWRARLREE
mmetsp:Transcript_52643/g.135890  ORF Transcript_52643/g.135890 Transcript_52643/m.135890 type:complete len:305 (-) Transcript_52643:115-1029(-)